MTVISTKPTPEQTLFELRPNASMTNRQYVGLCIWVSVFLIIISLRFLIIGAWMIVPFTILDTLFVIIILRIVRNSNNRIEEIHCSSDQLIIYRGKGRSLQQWQFNPYWAKVIIKKNPHPWYPSRLLIRSHGKSVELGKYLTEEEKEKLAYEIVESCKSKSY